MFLVSGTEGQAPCDAVAEIVDEMSGAKLDDDRASDAKGVAEGTEGDLREAVQMGKWSMVDQERHRRSWTLRWKITGVQQPRQTRLPLLLLFQHPLPQHLWTTILR